MTKRFQLPPVADSERIPLVRSAAPLILEDLVAMLELVELDVEALPDGTHPGVPDEYPAIRMSLLSL